MADFFKQVEQLFLYLDDTPNTYSGIDYIFLKVNENKDGLIFGPVEFVDIGITSVSGHGGQYVYLNLTENKLDFKDIGFLDLIDTPTTYSGIGSNKYLKVKDDLTGLEYTTVSGAGVNNFLDLFDTPTTYSGSENKTLQVNGDGSGVRFVTATTGYPKYFIPTDVEIFVGDYEQYVIHDRLYLEVAGSIELSVGAEIILMELHS